MTQIAEPAAEIRETESVSLADAILARIDSTPPSSVEEPASEVPETEPTRSQEPASPAPENSDAPKDGETRVPRSKVAETLAQNEQLKLTQAELEQLVQTKVKEAEDARTALQQAEQTRTERQQQFEQYAGTRDEYQRLEKLSQDVGLRVGSDPYATVTDEEQQQLSRFRDLKSRQEFSDLYDQRAWSTVLEAQRQDLGAAITACPGVDQAAVNDAPSFTAIYRHFYEAGAASRQDEIERLSTQMKGLTTKANISAKAPAVGGASGAPPSGGGDATTLGGAIMARLQSQGQWDE